MTPLLSPSARAPEFHRRHQGPRRTEAWHDERPLTRPMMLRRGGRSGGTEPTTLPVVVDSRETSSSRVPSRSNPFVPRETYDSLALSTDELPKNPPPGCYSGEGKGFFYASFYFQTTRESQGTVAFAALRCAVLLLKFYCRLLYGRGSPQNCSLSRSLLVTVSVTRTGKSAPTPM